jgi:hypothetical protein
MKIGTEITEEQLNEIIEIDKKAAESFYDGDPDYNHEADMPPGFLGVMSKKEDQELALDLGCLDIDFFKSNDRQMALGEIVGVQFLEREYRAIIMKHVAYAKSVGSEAEARELSKKKAKLQDMIKDDPAIREMYVMNVFSNNYSLAWVRQIQREPGRGPVLINSWMKTAPLPTPYAKNLKICVELGHHILTVPPPPGARAEIIKELKDRVSRYGTVVAGTDAEDVIARAIKVEERMERMREINKQDPNRN